MMSPVDNNSIGIRDIDTVLDNGRGEQHVIVVINEVIDHLFQFVGLHLSMTDGDTSFRHIAVYHVSDTSQVVDTGIDKEHLSVA